VIPTHSSLRKEFSANAINPIRMLYGNRGTILAKSTSDKAELAARRGWKPAGLWTGMRQPGCLERVEIMLIVINF
jgi:hypothetical protein